VGVKKRNRRLSSRSKTTCVDQKTFYKTFRFVSKQAFVVLAQTRSSALLSPLDTSRKIRKKEVERLRHFLTKVSCFVFAFLNRSSSVCCTIVAYLHNADVVESSMLRLAATAEVEPRRTLRELRDSSQTRETFPPERRLSKACLSFSCKPSVSTGNLVSLLPERVSRRRTGTEAKRLERLGQKSRGRVLLSRLSRLATRQESELTDVYIPVLPIPQSSRLLSFPVLCHFVANPSVQLCHSSRLLRRSHLLPPPPSIHPSDEHGTPCRKSYADSREQSERGEGRKVIVCWQFLRLESDSRVVCTSWNSLDEC